MIAWYLATRDKTKLPSYIETFSATLWLWLRRILGITLGGILIATSIFMVVSNPNEKSLFSIWLASILCAMLGVFLVRFGLFGDGDKRHNFRDAVNQHSDNKRRYHWWF